MTSIPVTYEAVEPNQLPALVYMTFEELSDDTLQLYVGFVLAGIFCHADLRGVVGQDGMFEVRAAKIKTLGTTELEPGDLVTFALTMLDTLASEQYQHLIVAGCYDPLTILVQDAPEGVDEGPTFN